MQNFGHFVSDFAHSIQTPGRASDFVHELHSPTTGFGTDGFLIA